MTWHSVANFRNLSPACIWRSFCRISDNCGNQKLFLPREASPACSGPVVHRRDPDRGVIAMGSPASHLAQLPISALPQKRTLVERVGMSALCQKQTFGDT